MILAAIFTSAEDRFAAHATKKVLETHGWRADVVVDGNETDAVSGESITHFDRLGTLNGRECILGIAEYLLRQSAPGDICVKVDADMVIRNPEWLAGSQNLVARCYRHGNRDMGGLWSATHEHLMLARNYCLTMPMFRGQPESFAFMAAFSATGSLESKIEGKVSIFKSNPIELNADVITLSSNRLGRKERLVSLFNLPG
jgi:hypothetical protein